MVNYSREFMKKTFTAESQKEAYLKGAKWFATNVIAKNIKNVTCSVTKADNTVVYHLYANLDEKMLEEEHCKICRESHSLFYMNDGANCSSCNLKAYQKRMEQRLSVVCGYNKERVGND